MKVIERSVVIQAPIEKVFPGMDEAPSAQPLPDPMILPLPVPGWQTGTAEIREWEPGKKIAGVAAIGPVQVRWRLLFQPLAHATRMTSVNELQVPGLLRVVEPLVVYLATRAI